MSKNIDAAIGEPSFSGEELAQRFRRGDLRAFDEIVKGYQPMSLFTSDIRTGGMGKHPVDGRVVVLQGRQDVATEPQSRALGFEKVAESKPGESKRQAGREGGEELVVAEIAEGYAAGPAPAMELAEKSAGDKAADDRKVGRIRQLPDEPSRKESARQGRLALPEANQESISLSSVPSKELAQAQYGQNADSLKRSKVADDESRARSGKKKAVAVPAATHPQPLPGGKFEKAESLQREESFKSVPLLGGDRGGLAPSAIKADSLAAAPPAPSQAAMAASDKETRGLSRAVAPARKPDTAFKQAAAKDAAAPRPTEIQTDLSSPPAAPAAVTLAAAPPAARPDLREAENAPATAPPAKGKAGGRAVGTASAPQPGATWLVVTADPAAVLKTVAPYRKPPEAKKDQAETATQPAAQARPEMAAKEPVLPGAGAGGGEEGKEVPSAETLLTLWVPVGEYPGLVKQIKELGETTEDIPPADIFKLVAEGTRLGGTPSDELIPVQVRIRQR